MHEIKQFAEILLTGSYDHVLPRPSNRDSLTIRQIAASYDQTWKKACDDDIITARAIAIPTSLAIAAVTVIASIYQDGTQLVIPKYIIYGFVMFGMSFFFLGLIAFGTVTHLQWHSSRKTLNESSSQLLQIRDEMNALAKAIGMGNYESLQGYDRKVLASMAHQTGANLYALNKQHVNSDDVKERQVAEDYRKSLDNLHTLLGRLDLQPKGGYPTYGRLAAETA